MSHWIKMLSFLLLAALTACGGYRVSVNAPSGASPLPDGAPFRITRGSPPENSKFVGRVSFYGSTRRVDSMLETVRERARQVGANLVAKLRCQGVATTFTPTRFGAPVGPSYVGAATVDCSGLLYRR